jgi:2-polyprenyl-3-methyl-5-hydroxy-6-metoxy-1,4-benzoquinol methylase
VDEKSPLTRRLSAARSRTAQMTRSWPNELAMRRSARRAALKTKIRKAQQPSYDPYASCGIDDSGGWIGPLPVKVFSVLDLTEDVDRSGIQRGMRVLELGCGAGEISIWIAKLVGPAGLVVGVDESAEVIDTAEKRATVSGQCYWTRFVAADLNTFIPRGRFDVVVVRSALLLRREERAALLRLSTFVYPDGFIIITGNPGENTDNLRKSPTSHAAVFRGGKSSAEFSQDARRPSWHR